MTSRQDTSTYRSDNKSAGLSVTVAPGGGVSGSANFASGKRRGDYKSVVEQSGIVAGQQGYAIKVAGETALTGGVIASAAPAEKNRLETGTLKTSDIQNSERWKASSLSLGAGYGPGVARDKDGNTVSTGAGAPVAGSGPGKVSATAPVAMNAKGKQDGQTLSAIAPGSLIITSGDAASQQAAATVSRDTSSANAGALVKQYDDAKRTEIGQGFEATKALTQETATFFANRGQEEQDKRDKAKEAYAKGNAALGKQLEEEADSLRRNYGSGSAARMVATALTGAAGSDVTGSLGGLVQGAAVNVIQSKLTTEVKYLVDTIADPVKRETARAALQGLVGCAGATAGGSGSCGSAAMGAAASVVINNILTSLEGKKQIVAGPDGKPRDARNIEDEEGRANIVASLVTAIAEGAGLNASSASIAARIETENNANQLDKNGKIIVDQAQGRLVPPEQFASAQQAYLNGLKSGTKAERDLYNKLVAPFGDDDKKQIIYAALQDTEVGKLGGQSAVYALINGGATIEQLRGVAPFRVEGTFTAFGHPVQGQYVYDPILGTLLNVEGNNSRFIGLWRDGGTLFEGEATKWGGTFGFRQQRGDVTENSGWLSSDNVKLLRGALFNKDGLRIDAHLGAGPFESKGRWTIGDSLTSEGRNRFGKLDFDVKLSIGTENYYNAQIAWDDKPIGRVNIGDRGYETIRNIGEIITPHVTISDAPKNSLPAGRLAAEKVKWVDEGAGMSTRARAYDDGASGSRSNVETRKGQAPTLSRTTTDGAVNFVRFDGVEGDVMIDRKISIVTTQKTKAQALRQAEALRQNGLMGRWEVPTQAQADRAIKLLRELEIDNIKVRVVPE